VTSVSYGCGVQGKETTLNRADNDDHDQSLLRECLSIYIILNHLFLIFGRQAQHMPPLPIVTWSLTRFFALHEFSTTAAFEHGLL
jgi:hypothetical protein